MLRYLNRKLIVKVSEASKKEEIIDKLIDLIDLETDLLISKDDFREKIYAREAIGTTGIGRGIVVPHARCEQVKDIVFAVALVKGGITDYNTPDGEKAKLVILVAAPKNRNSEYLKLLADISRAFRQSEFRDNILLSNDLDDLIEGLAHLGE